MNLKKAGKYTLKNLEKGEVLLENDHEDCSGENLSFAIGLKNGQDFTVFFDECLRISLTGKGSYYGQYYIWEKK